jgi:hypothetical protein
MLRPSGKAKKIYDHLMKGEGMPRKKKKQGYDDRLDESLGMRHRGRKKQSMKARRDESKGVEKAFTGHAYGKVSTMDKGRKRSKKK